MTADDPGAPAAPLAAGGRPGTPCDVLLYARGGGCGHAMRMAELQRALCARGLRVELLVRPGSARHLARPLPAGGWLAEDGWAAARARARGALLVVDTFPRGWEGEVTSEDLRAFRRAVLVARYSRDPRVAEDAGAFDAVLAPYPADLDEWAAPPAGAVHTGWLVGPAPVVVESGGDAFVVVDPGGRLPAALAAQLARHAGALGLRMSALRAWPAALRAAKILCLGAGYNTVYELAGARADLRFLPLARRWDDQGLRARRVGRAVEGLDDLLAWLAAPVRAAGYPAGHRYAAAALAPILRCA